MTSSLLSLSTYIKRLTLLSRVKVDPSPEKAASIVMRILYGKTRIGPLRRTGLDSVIGIFGTHSITIIGLHFGRASRAVIGI